MADYYNLAYYKDVAEPVRQSLRAFRRDVAAPRRQHHCRAGDALSGGRDERDHREASAALAICAEASRAVMDERDVGEGQRDSGERRVHAWHLGGRRSYLEPRRSRRRDDPADAQNGGRRSSASRSRRGHARARGADIGRHVSRRGVPAAGAKRRPRDVAGAGAVVAATRRSSVPATRHATRRACSASSHPTRARCA